MLAHYKLRKVETEVIVMVYHKHAKEDAELLNDFKRKYLPSIFSNDTDNIKVKTFERYCKGMLENWCISPLIQYQLKSSYRFVY